MRKKLLLGALFLSISVSCVFASVTVKQTTDATYLRNSGFSAQTTDIVNVSKSRATGTEYYTPQEQKERKENFFVHFWRKWYTYTDPAAEDNSFFHHDTKSTPISSDL